MSEFSSVDAAFFGLGRLRRDPMRFLGVALGMFVMMIAFMLILGPMYAVMINAMVTGAGPAEVDAAVSAYIVPMLLFIPVSFVLTAIIMAALLRALVFDAPPKGWFLGLRLGGDELRVFWVYLAVTFLLMGGYLVVGGIGVGLSVVVAMASQALGAVLMFFVVIAVICMLIYLAVRFSLALPATIGERQVFIFRSWAMTKGRFWPLFLAYALVYALFVIGYMAVAFLGLIGFVALGSSVDVSGGVGGAGLTVGLVVGAVLLAALYTVVYALFMGVGAYAYRQIGGGAPEIAEAFE